LSSGPVPLISPRESGQPSRNRVPFSPSFDGVFSNGDSWVARRRVSEGLSRVGVKGESGGGEVQPDIKESDIKEEEEDGVADINPNQIGHGNVCQPKSQPRPGPSHSPPAGSSSNEHPEVLTASSGTRNSSLSTETSVNGTGFPATSTGPTPPGIDISGVEWSYLDPQGQVQGTIGIR
jgi:PERQ amino acid-rich with GYF domain-containing protein